MIIMNGKTVANTIYDKIKEEMPLSRPPALATIIVGNDFSSVKYVEMKMKKCEELKFYSRIIRLLEDVSEPEIIEKINGLNDDTGIDGILIQLPLPNHLNQNKILSYIIPEKDVEGMTPTNMGKLVMEIYDPIRVPCTPVGIMVLLDYYQLALKGCRAVIINHSSVIGKPLAMLLLRRGCTVTVCHEDTVNLKTHTLSANILVSGTGVPNLILPDMVSPDSVVIDAGINLVSGKVSGDVSSDITCKYFARVPGGVGIMTVAMLMNNVFEISKERQKK